MAFRHESGNCLFVQMLLKMSRRRITDSDGRFDRTMLLISSGPAAVWLRSDRHDLISDKVNNLL